MSETPPRLTIPKANKVCIEAIACQRGPRVSMHTMSVDPALSPRSKPVKHELEINFVEPERMSQLSIPCPRTRKTAVCDLRQYRL